MRSFSYRIKTNLFYPTVLILLTAISAVAQSSQPVTSAAPPANTSPTPNSGGTIQAPPSQVAAATGVPGQVSPAEDSGESNPTLRRIERARALAAAHQLPQAATDLENVRASVSDVTLRNVTTLMLIGIYLEEGNYTRAQALLEESFMTRKIRKDESLRTYFAMAGQTVNGIRSHIARYRSFGINPGDSGLPPEANADLDRVRGVLERVAAQAKEISNEAGRSYDAVALQEDVVGIRLSLARDATDRDKWQAEYVTIREKLATSQAQSTSVGRSALLDAVTARIPNPFDSKQNNPTTAPSDNSTANVAGPGQSTTTSTDVREPQLVSTGSLSGRETKRVTPVYPPAAKNTGITGTVRVFAIVDENGKVWVTNSEGPSLLRRAAEDAAKNWTFPPSSVSGRPVRLAGYLDFDFKL